MDRIAALIPSPRRHRRHYHGVFAPNSPLRKKIIGYANGLTITSSIRRLKRQRVHRLNGHN